MKKVVIIFGTRPEVIKMAPLAIELAQSDRLKPICVATAQHRSLLDQPLAFFGLKPEFDLNLMKDNQDLFDITMNCLGGLRNVYREVRPDVVLVQGDTTTTFAAALAAFYEKIPVGHVEAGLRTWEKYSPFPEEMNRSLVTPLADYHFAPTPQSVKNLRLENVAAEKIFLTGNTAIDALLWGKERIGEPPHLKALFGDRKLILMTAHRRENFGAPLKEIFEAVKEFAVANPGFHIVYPVHPNPNVKGLAQDILFGLPNVSLIAPVNYDELLYLMRECQFVLTDSGGLQEESPALGKPVLVLRKSTERPEAVEAGCAKLVGHDRSEILKYMQVLSDPRSQTYQSMSQAKNPFGDGTAAKQIRKQIELSI